MITMTPNPASHSFVRSPSDSLIDTLTRSLYLYLVRLVRQLARLAISSLSSKLPCQPSMLSSLSRNAKATSVQIAQDERAKRMGHNDKSRDAGSSE